MREKEKEYMLSPYRVLDLTDEKGLLCGKILADLGADTIKIERPGGDMARNIGPFFRDVPHPKRSLFWFAYNANKRGITLNIEVSDGRDIFKKLVNTADFVIESFPPGYMDQLGLGYEALSQVNPRVIMTSISPFGQGGPYEANKASDIVLMAMAGIMRLSGDRDRPPVRISIPQAYLHAGSEAAVGTMIAHYFRELTGEGQHVDVSAQASTCPATTNAWPWWDLMKVNLERTGSYRTGANIGAKQRLNWSCKDGYVCFAALGGRTGAPTNRALVEWMDSEGIAPDFLKKMDWEAFDMSTATQEFFDLIEKPIQEFFARHDKQELFEEAIKRGMMLYPVYGPRDIVEDPQLAARGFWVKVEHSELDTMVTYPGAFAKLSESYCGIRHPPPLIGEHNEEIYREELGFTQEELIALRQGGVI